KGWYWPALAGFRAFRLLLSEAPAVLTNLPSEVWQNWAPAILAYPTSGTVEESEAMDPILKMAYEHAPQEIIDTLLVLIDWDNQEIKALSMLHKVSSIWDDRLGRALAPKARDKKLTPSSMGSLLDELLKHKVPEAREFTESLVTLPIPARGVGREKAVTANRKIKMW